MNNRETILATGIKALLNFLSFLAIVASILSSELDSNVVISIYSSLFVFQFSYWTTVLSKFDSIMGVSWADVIAALSILISISVTFLLLLLHSQSVGFLIAELAATCICVIVDMYNFYKVIEKYMLAQAGKRQRGDTSNR